MGHALGMRLVAGSGIEEVHDGFEERGLGPKPSRRVVEPMIELLIFGVVVSGVIARMVGKSSWQSVGVQLDLVYLDRFSNGRRLLGRLRGFEVEVEEAKDARGHNKTIVARVQGVDPGFTLGKDNAVFRVIKPDIETGDQLFDERTRIEGDADRALAVLGDRERRLAEILISGLGGEVTRNTISVFIGSIDKAPSTLDSMLDLAQVLRRPQEEELPGLLGQRALEDPSRGVQLQAFRRLAHSFPGSNVARDTAERLLDAPYGSLRLEAARVLLADPDRAERASTVLQDLAARLHVDSSIRREAIQRLATSRFRQAAVPTMVALLDSGKSEPPSVRHAALEALVQARAHQEMLVFEPVDVAEAELLVRGLGRVGGSAQPRLLELFEHPEKSVQREAAVSLGKVGDLGAVAALRKVAGSDKLFRSAVARAAEAAISDIQSRHGGSQAGEISLASVEPLQGAVSLTEGSEGGEVSLTP